VSDPVVARRWILSFALVAAVLVSAFERSLSVGLFGSWVVNSLPLMLLSLSAGVIIACGRIDISSGAAMSAVGMVIVATAGLFGMSITGLLLGHAFAISYLALLYGTYHLATRAGVPSIIATLAGFLISKGVSTVIQTCALGVGEICPGGAGIARFVLPQSSFFAGLFDSLGFNLAVAVSVIVAMHSWRYHTISGLRHVAVGMDEDAAGYARIDRDRVRALAFGLAAALVLLATLVRLYGQNNGGWAPNTGWGDELIAIAIAVVGGARVSGGHFDAIGIAAASLAVYVWRDIIINDLGVPTEATSMVFGILLLAISWADLRQQQRA
jgi:ribose/xylose/arabinose/galactoside ABC-type transport system permease subunit